MAHRDQRAKEIANSIREILLTDWDPIGVMEDPEWPRDEYDTYVGQIYGFLVRGESADFIARHLCFIEEKLMGLGTPGELARMDVAFKLKALDISLSA